MPKTLKPYLVPRLRIGVVGLGYVGLPLAVSASKAGHLVLGVDIDHAHVGRVNSGDSRIQGVATVDLLHAIKHGKFQATTNYDDLRDVDCVLICVPTPLTVNKKPDLSYVENAVKNVAKVLKKDTLVILESTVAPGTTRNVVLPILRTESRLDLSDVEVAYSPERVDPGNRNWNISNTPKIVAGLTPTALARASKFYSSFIQNIFECSTVEVAEMAKLLENTYRFVNISFINEFAQICEALGIQVNEVINAAATKPYGFMQFTPSLGVGGHCIPVDPIYLADAALKSKASTKFIDLAIEVNNAQPSYFAKKAQRILGDLRNKKILLVGVAYKSNVSDVRETPAKALRVLLEQMGAIVVWHDELVMKWEGEESVPMNNSFDLAILVTLHDYMSFTDLGTVPLLNTQEINQ